MSVIGTLGAAAKAVFAGVKTLTSFLASAAPAVGKAVSTGIVKLGASATTAKVAGKVAEIGTAYIISKAVDKVTDVTIEKVPGIGPFIGFSIDLANDINLIKGVWK